MSEVPVWERSPDPPTSAHAPLDQAVATPGPGLAERAPRSASNQALQRLVSNQPGESRAGEVGEGVATASASPSADASPFQELPIQQAVQLVKPLTPTEVAQELYGDAEHWHALVLAPNRALLSTKQGDRLPAGTQLRVLPELLREPMRSLFMAVAGLARQGREGGSQPYIHANPESSAAVGNVVRYSFAWPNAAFVSENVLLEWWLEHDPVAVRTEGAPLRVEGPKGYLSVRGNERWLVTFDFPGMHVVHCRMRGTNHTYDLSHPQMVMTLEERTETAAAAKPKPPIPPDKLLSELKQQKADMQVTDANLDEYRALLDRIADLETAITKTGKDGMKPLRAIYVSAAKAPVTLPLTVYFGLDPYRAGRVRLVYHSHGRRQPDQYFYLRLWDFTDAGKERSYIAFDKSPDAAVRKLLEGFADDAPYPKGNIRFQVEETDLSWSGKDLSYAVHASAQTLTFPTDGGWRAVDVLRLASGLALGAAVAAALIAPPAVVPILKVSGALAGAAAAVSLADRIAHGDAKWDLQTATDLLDIASALLWLRTIFAATEVVEGLGRMTLTGALELGIGQAQLGIMAGAHLREITEAINSKDEQRVVAALSAGIRDGAILIILHRASSRSTQPEGPQPRSLPGGQAARENVEAPPRRQSVGPVAKQDVTVPEPPPAAGQPGASPAAELGPTTTSIPTDEAVKPPTMAQPVAKHTSPEERLRVYVLRAKEHGYPTRPGLNRILGQPSKIFDQAMTELEALLDEHVERVGAPRRGQIELERAEAGSWGEEAGKPGQVRSRPPATTELVPLRRSQIDAAHQLGVKGGEEAAAADGIKLRNANLPDEHILEYGRGFDAIGDDANATFVLEWKGENSKVKGAQMTSEWVGKRLAKLKARYNHPIADELLAVAESGKLRGRVYTTKTVEGQPEKTSQDVTFDKKDVIAAYKEWVRKLSPKSATTGPASPTPKG